jgi:hypothetical protein
MDPCKHICNSIQANELCNVSLLCCIHALQSAFQANSFTNESKQFKNACSQRSTAAAAAAYQDQMDDR